MFTLLVTSVPYLRLLATKLNDSTRGRELTVIGDVPTPDLVSLVENLTTFRLPPASRQLRLVATNLSQLR